MPSLRASYEESVILKRSREIENAISCLLDQAKTAEKICKKAKERFHFDFAAVQLVDLDEQTIQTIYGLDEQAVQTTCGASLRREWYKIAKHSLEGPMSFLDIQAHVALAWPPRIEIVSGWDSRFDAFIFERFGHEHYVRAFVPLIVTRGQDGSLAEAHPEQFLLSAARQGSARSIEIAPQPPFDLHKNSLEIIGTIEAGFDNSRRDHEKGISNEDAEQLFRQACRYAVRLHKATIRQVFDVITRNAKEILQADWASLHYPFDPARNRYTYNIWRGPRELQTLHPRPGGLGEKAIKAGQPQFLPSSQRTGREATLEEGNPNVYKAGIKTMSAFPLVIREREISTSSMLTNSSAPSRRQGILYVGFKSVRNFTKSEIGCLQLFTRMAVDAISHATYHLHAIHSARQLANLHEVARQLADETDTQYLLHSIAGHTRNILAADVVIIYEYDDSQQHFLPNPASAGRLASDIHGLGAQTGNYIPSTQILDERENIYAESPEDVFKIFSSGGNDKSARKFVESERIDTGAAVILQLGSEIVGLMFISYRRLHHFSIHEKRFVETLASTAAIAIRNRRLLRTRQDNVLAMTHQLRNPLSSMRMRMSMLRRHIRSAEGGDERVLQYLYEELSGIADHLDIADILCEGIFISLTQEAEKAIGGLDRDYTDAHPELMRLWRLLQAVRDRGDLKLVCNDEVYRSSPIQVARGIFVNVIYSLFHNAMKYAELNSDVLVEWAIGSPELALLKVSTIGPPIDVAEKEAIFQKFRRGSAMGQSNSGGSGIGLGLWVARELMRSVGGDVSLHLTPEQPRFSTFVVRIPFRYGDKL
jgi:signal transduction histidine kinase